MSNLEGVCAPICSVFTEDGRRIDETAQCRHIDSLLEAGVHIIAACGGTGEFSFLTRDERISLTELIARRIDGKAKLLVHASAVMTEETIDYARHAQDCGANGLLILPPYFEGPTLAGVYEHYEKVAAAVQIEIMAYNIPVHTGIDLQPGFVQRLMEIDNITCIKDSTGDFIRIQQLINAGINVFNGADPLMLHSLMAGARGCFWGTSNAIPADAVKLYHLCQDKQWEQARLLWQKIYKVNDFVWNNPFNPSVKALAKLLGHDLRHCRRPVQPLTDDQMASLISLVDDF